MARGQRVGIILSAIVFAAIAFIVLRPDDDDDGDSTQVREPAGQTQQEEPGGEEPAPEPEVEVETIRIANGEVSGGERRIRASKDDVVRIEVRSDIPDEIHLHGYDVYRDVAPGKPARFRVKADLEGVFELEAHDLGHVVVGTLVVEP